MLKLWIVSGLVPPLFTVSLLACRRRLDVSGVGQFTDGQHGTKVSHFIHAYISWDYNKGAEDIPVELCARN